MSRMANFKLFCLFLAAVLIAFLVWAYLSIDYQFEPAGIRITWGLWSDVIPADSIQSIAPLTQVIGTEGAGWQPFWPGYYVGKRNLEIGTVSVIATLPPRRQVLISVADGRHFAISPERPLLFMEAFTRWHAQAMHSEGATQSGTGVPGVAERFVEAGWTTEFTTHPVAAATGESPAGPRESAIDGRPDSTSESPQTRVFRSPPSATSPLLRPTILRDPVALTFTVVGVLTTAAMVVYILTQYQDIPPSLTLHWNVDGLPGRVGEPREIWVLPTIAGLVLIANLGLAWSIALFDRFAARLMLGSTICVHVVTWVALIMILR
jgi:hypothetical protein